MNDSTLFFIPTQDHAADTPLVTLALFANITPPQASCTEPLAPCIFSTDSTTGNRPASTASDWSDVGFALPGIFAFSPDGSDLYIGGDLTDPISTFYQFLFCETRGY